MHETDGNEPTLLELAELAYATPEHVHCEICDERIEWAEAGVVRYSHAGLWALAMEKFFDRHSAHLESCKIKKGPLPNA